MVSCPWDQQGRRRLPRPRFRWRSRSILRPRLLLLFLHRIPQHLLQPQPPQPSSSWVSLSPSSQETSSSPLELLVSFPSRVLLRGREEGDLEGPFETQEEGRPFQVELGERREEEGRDFLGLS